MSSPSPPLESEQTVLFVALFFVQLFAAHITGHPNNIYLYFIYCIRDNYVALHIIFAVILYSAISALCQVSNEIIDCIGQNLNTPTILLPSSKIKQVVLFLNLIWLS